jgi:hypothetical protein
MAASAFHRFDRTALPVPLRHPFRAGHRDNPYYDKMILVLDRVRALGVEKVRCVCARARSTRRT